MNATFFANFNCPTCFRSAKSLQMNAELFSYDPALADAHARREVIERQQRRCPRCSTPLTLAAIVPHGVFPSLVHQEEQGA